MDKITIWIRIENFYIAEGRVKVAILDPKIKRYTDLRKSVHQIAPKYFVMKESISGFFSKTTLIMSNGYIVYTFSFSENTFIGFLSNLP